MKIEIGETKPAHYTEYWPGQYKFFSHFEYVSGVPHALFLITTLKAKSIPRKTPEVARAKGRPWPTCASSNRNQADPAIVLSV
ncbi:MAG: hypothetical protein WC708_20070 [Lentisphaeria bacterium]